MAGIDVELLNNCAWLCSMETRKKRNIAKTVRRGVPIVDAQCVYFGKFSFLTLKIFLKISQQ